MVNHRSRSFSLSATRATEQEHIENIGDVEMVIGCPFDRPDNEIDNILTYSSGTHDREDLVREIESTKGRCVDIPLIIGGREVRTGDCIDIKCPHDPEVVLARAHMGREEELEAAMGMALRTHQSWSEKDCYFRSAIFMKAADILAGPSRIKNIAAIMLNQSKNPYEAEIDLAELVDFWRFNTYYLEYIYNQAPQQYRGEINRFDWRPLEGFVLAISPFNFFSIAGNLPTAPAMVGNVVLWKPARSVLFANYQIMKILIEAGLPKGVINFVPFSSRYSDTVMKNPNLAGLHFTGSYETLIEIWRTIGMNIDKYRGFPRIVGETGGKDFIFVHNSANMETVVSNIVSGGFGYQGQKCSAASRIYVPKSWWPKALDLLLEKLSDVRYGPVDDLGNFMGALIDEDAYRRVVEYIEYARSSISEYELVYGGDYSSSRGYFIQPTVFLTKDPKSRLMTEEIFGPVIVIFIYDDEKYDETLKLCDSTSPFGLTGSIFAHDREAIDTAENVLRYSAGNFYINDKPTGAVVARQPFGGSRHSGTNDKAGYWNNLLRWINPRTIKETTIPSIEWKRPYMG